MGSKSLWIQAVQTFNAAFHFLQMHSGDALNVSPDVYINAPLEDN